MIQVHARTTNNAAAIPEELMRSVPRHWRLTASGKWVLGAAVFMAVGAVAFSVGAYISAKRSSSLRREMAEQGQIASATVVRTYRTGDEDKRDVFIYRFAIEGKTYTGRTDIGARRSPRYPVGSEIRVRYLPSRPATNWIDGYAPSGMPLFVIPIMCAGLLAGAYAMFWHLRRQEELVSEGRAALARVLSVKRVSRDPKKKRAQIEFPLLSGARQEASLEFDRKAPQPNSTIVVLYDRDNPRRILRYPACLIRVAGPGEW